MIRKIKIKRDHIVGYGRCVGCDKEFNPAFMYEGSMITGVRFQTLIGVERLPITAVIETYEKSYIIGGGTVETKRKASFLERKRGLICTTCASNYQCIEDSKGVKHPIIILKARPGFIGTTIVPVYEREER